MIKTIFLSVAFIFIMGAAMSQFTVQESHIIGNVPSPRLFEQFLRRDLLAYFKSSGFAGATAIEYQLLRKEPTQSGVANPKYYAWVKVFAGTTLQQEGAVRVAAVEQRFFEVTNFLSKIEILQRPDEAGKTFQAALVPAIVAHAGAP